MSDFYKKHMKNRELILNEYDDIDNIIDSRKMGDEFLSIMIISALSRYREKDILRINTINIFSDDEWRIISKIIATDISYSGCNSRFLNIDYHREKGLTLH